MITKETLRRNALLIFLGGSALLGMLVFGLGVLSVASQTSRPMAAQTQDQSYPQGGGYGQAQADTQDQGGNSDEGQMPQNYGSVPVASGYVASGASAPDAGNDAITNGYWDRQRSQDQPAQAYDQTIRDTNTIQDTQTGEVHSDVSNSVADPAIQSGAATEVPTSELPTSEPTPSSDAGATSTAE